MIAIRRQVAGGRTARADAFARSWRGLERVVGALPMRPLVVPFVFTLACLSQSSPAIGQDAAGNPENPPTLTAFGIRGEAIFKNFSQLRKTATDTWNIRNEVILRVEWARQLTQWASIDLVGDARADDDGLTQGITFRIPDTARHRSHLNLAEAVIRLRRDPVEITVGKQVYAWGTGDAFNPTDNINPYDYLDPIGREKLGVYSAALRATRGAASLTVVIIPFFTPSRVPLPSSPWTPPPPPGVIDDSQVPPTTFENTALAARARGTFRGWDVALSYFDGFEDTPVIRQSSAVLTPSVTVPRFTHVFTRLRTPGVDFSTTYRSFEFHGELAAKLVSSNGAEHRLQGIAGLNYTWDEGTPAWIERIEVVLEYAREAALGQADSTILTGRAATRAALPDNAFRNAVMGALRFTFNENTQTSLSGTGDFTGTLNHYLQAKVTRRLADSLQLEADLEFFGGPRDSFWGRWTNNDTERQARKARIRCAVDRSLGGQGDVSDVFAADHHGALDDAGRDQRIGKIDRREHAGARIQDVERQRMAEAEAMLENQRRAGLDREANVGSVAAGDVRAEEKLDLPRSISGARETVGNRLRGEVNRELRVAGHSPGLDTSQCLKWQVADEGTTAAQHLARRHRLRWQVHAETLDDRRRLGLSASSCRRRGRHDRALGTSQKKGQLHVSLVGHPTAVAVRPTLTCDWNGCEGEADRHQPASSVRAQRLQQRPEASMKDPRDFWDER